MQTLPYFALLLVFASCASQPRTPEPASTIPRVEPSAWEAHPLSHADDEEEWPVLVQQVGRTTVKIPAFNAQREARRGMACPLDSGTHLGLTFRAPADTFEAGRSLVLHIQDPDSHWGRALRFDARQDVFCEDCSAVDLDDAREALREGPAEQGYQPLAFWLHLPSEVDPRRLHLTWSIQGPESS